MLFHRDPEIMIPYRVTFSDSTSTAVYVTHRFPLCPSLLLPLSIAIVVLPNVPSSLFSLYLLSIPSCCLPKTPYPKYFLYQDDY
jgi:hypothetical protein